MKHPVSILLLDPHQLFREAFAALIKPCQDVYLVGEAGTVDEARLQLKNSSIDLVLMELNLPGDTGFSLLKHLQGGHMQGGHTKEPPVVVLTSELHPEYVREALCLGALGYITKYSDSRVLLKAIKVAQQRHTVLDHYARQALIDEVPPDCITQRECQVLTLIAEGASNAEISKRLYITEKTVKTHVGHLLDKLGVSNRVHLAIYAQTTRLLETPDLYTCTGED
jgi:DNA-binding NarL/FixJ family response regulator